MLLSHSLTLLLLRAPTSEMWLLSAYRPRPRSVLRTGHCFNLCEFPRWKTWCVQGDEQDTSLMIWSQMFGIGQVQNISKSDETSLKAATFRESNMCTHSTSFDCRFKLLPLGALGNITVLIIIVIIVIIIIIIIIIIMTLSFYQAYLDL